MHVPTALLSFPKELMYSPRVWAAAKFTDLRQFTHAARGGHFAALEAPDELIASVVAFVREVADEL